MIDRHSDGLRSNACDDLAGAQARAAEMFAELGRRGVIVAGETEASISETIFVLGEREFGTGRHWHRRVVRSGPNSRLPFRTLVPDRTIEGDDIVSIDLGPVFGEWEADFGRTYVVGANPEKIQLRDDLEVLFHACGAFYRRRPEMTGAELYDHVVRTCASRGWGFGGAHAGHLVGRFPIAREDRDAARNRIRPDNDVPMNAPNLGGTTRSWILEIHLLDPTGAFGGFFEDSLNPLLARPCSHQLVRS